jgi:two-component system response regulator YesN
MYSVVIVDDEYISREGLASFISSIGYNVLSTFKDGKEVIEYLKTNPVDIVITDIKMNEVDGIEVTKYIYTNKLKTKTILMSGYKVFEYAKNALAYDVEYYLLKPIKMDEVTEVMEAVSRKIDVERSGIIDQDDKIQKYKEILPAIAEQVFFDIATGIIKKSDIQSKLNILGLKEFFGDRLCSIINVEINEINSYLLNVWHYNKERFDVTIKNMLLEKNELTDTFYAVNNENQIVIVAVSKEQTGLEKFQFELEKYFENLKECILNILELKISIAEMTFFGNIYDALNAIHNTSPIYNFEEKDLIVGGLGNDKSDPEATTIELIIEKTKAYIDENYMKDIVLEDIASMVYFSPTYFSRFFKQHTGETLTDYTVKIRMKKAIELLANGNAKIYKISEMVGYTNSKYFYKVFKKYTGYTPKEYYFRKVLATRGNENEKED